MKQTRSLKSTRRISRTGGLANTPGWWSKHWPLVVSLILVAVSLYVRYATRALTNTDMEAKVLVWYAKLQRHGPLVGLGKDFYNYTPPYLYLVALATFTSSYLAPLTAIKIIATIFDVFSAFMVARIVRLKYPEGFLPILAGSLFFAGPTFLLNSAVWGQADSTFAAFMLASLYFLLTSRPWLGMAAFAIGLALKPQGVFFVPLLLVLLLWGRLRWYHFLAAPIVYALCMLPAVVLGRTWYEVFTAYVGQADAGKALTHNAANIFVFVPRESYTWLLWPAVVFAVIVFLGWIYYTWRRTPSQGLQMQILVALVCVTLVPFLLPNMRERYYYLGDILSLILAFVVPSLWLYPLLFQTFSVLSYSMFLWGAPQTYLRTASILAAMTLVLLLRQQAKWSRSSSAVRSNDASGARPG